MSDLTAFLSARLDEDEAAAKAAASTDHTTLFSKPDMFAAEWRSHDSAVMVESDAGPVVYDEGVPTVAQAAHIARHDPARVLREVVAKRSLIEDHTGQCCVNDTCCGEIAGYFDSEAGDPCPVLLVLAAIYSDHPDYRQEWAVPSLA